MKRFLAAVAGAAILLTTGAATAAPYYQGKTFRIVIGFTPGGGNDLFARVFVDRLGRYIEGNPTVIVENRPGAGGVLALNWFTSVAPRDGTVAMVTSGNLVNRMALGTEGVTAKISDLHPLIAGPIGRTNYVYAGTGYKKPKDILNLKEPLYLGLTDPLSTIGSVVGLKLLNVPYKTVKGYPGKNDALLALERGESTVGDIATPIFNEMVIPSVKEGRVVPLYAHGMLDGDNLVRDPANTDLPTIAEFYKEIYGKDPSGPAWGAYKTVIRAIGNGGKILMVHSATPPEHIAMLKNAMAQLLKDKEFLKNAEAALEGYGFTFGEQLTANVDAISNMNPESKKWLQDLFATDYGFKFQ